MINLIVKTISILVATGFSTTFLGYWIHFAFHQPWSLWFYRAHMNHHQIQYPSIDFYSDRYRSAGKDNTTTLFLIAAIPVVLFLLLSILFGLISISTLLLVAGGTCFWGFLHDHFHDHFHIATSPWSKLPLFRNWRKLHYVHHLNMSLNYGIIFFYWDKLFKTYDAATDVELNKTNKE